VGFLMLVYCALSLFYTIEKAFNQIWGVRRPRSIPRRFTAYWTVLTVAPVCVAMSIGATTFMQSHEFYQYVVYRVPLVATLSVGLTPYVFSWFVFTAMYLFMPNTKVRFGPALAGGILAGTAWELMKALYVWVNVNFMSANAFYGSLGAIPVFLMWVYISWIIVLVGCEFAFAAQNTDTYRREIEAPKVSPEFRERLALLLLADIARDFLGGRSPRSATALAGGLNVPVRLVHELIEQLEEQELVRAVADGDRRDPALVPACDPGQTTVGDVLDRMHRHGDGRYALPPGATTDRLRGVLDEARARFAGPLRQVTLKDLATAGTPPQN
jgi:membrane protein